MQYPEYWKTPDLFSSGRKKRLTRKENIEQTKQFGGPAGFKLSK